MLNAFQKEPSNFGGGINFATLSVSRGFNDIFGAMSSSPEQFKLGSGGQRSSRRGGSGNLAAGQFLKAEANYQRLQLLTKKLRFYLELNFNGPMICWCH